MDNVKKNKILIVDDEDDLRATFRDILEAYGYEVDEAVDGQDCLDKLDQKKYDLVLLDLMMPKVDGMQALSKIKESKEKYGELKVIILTNLTSDIVIKEGFERQADGYLIKTELTPEQVIKEIKNHLG